MSTRRGGEPRRIGDIISPAVRRLTASDDARAYALWAKAAGGQVAGATSARAFNRGVLTIECESSVWANELEYLAGEILSRMTEMDPGHPVKRLRFRVRRRAVEQEEAPAASKSAGRGSSLRAGSLAAARAAADRVADDRLRASIRAALRAASGEPADGTAAGPGGHPEK